MIAKKIINSEEYLRISDISAISGVSQKVLRVWMDAGDLVNFLTIYKSSTGIHYFRLGVPNPTDQLIDGETFKYKLPDDGGTLCD